MSLHTDAVIIKSSHLLSLSKMGKILSGMLPVFDLNTKHSLSLIWKKKKKPYLPVRPNFAFLEPLLGSLMTQSFAARAAVEGGLASQAGRSPSPRLAFLEWGHANLQLAPRQMVSSCASSSFIHLDTFGLAWLRGKTQDSSLGIQDYENNFKGYNKSSYYPLNTSK